MDWQLNWQGVGAIMAIVVVLGTFALNLVRNGLRKDFVSVVDFSQLETRISQNNDRLTTVENRMASAPTHADLKDMGKRIGDLEVATATNTATLSAVKEGVQRVEHVLTLLVNHGLDKESGK